MEPSIAPVTFTLSTIAKIEDCHFCGGYVYTNDACSSGCTIELKKNQKNQLLLAVPGQGQEDTLLYLIDDARFTTSGGGLTEMPLVKDELEEVEILELYQGGRKYFYQ